MSKVTVSIVVHRTPASLLDKLMESILRSSSVASVYIIDNSPSDTLREHCSHFPRTIYLHVENRGYGAGHNVAIRKAMQTDARYHLVVNPDVRWEDDVIETLVEYMDSHPEVGQVMPRTIYPDGTLQHVCRRLPSPIDMLLRLALPQWMAPNRRKRYLMLDKDYEQPMSPHYMLGSFMFFRLDALRDIGLFDERFFMYPEDIDITRRMHEKYTTLYLPVVTIVHDHARASHKSLKMMHIHIVNMCRYFNKWGWFSDLGRRASWQE